MTCFKIIYVSRLVFYCCNKGLSLPHNQDRSNDKSNLITLKLTLFDPMKINSTRKQLFFANVDVEVFKK